MATVFSTRLIGNIGKDASVNTLDRGVVAINFPVAHNKNWRDKKTGEQKTKTTWINCTIWKKEGTNLRILDYLKKGTLVEIEGTPFPKAYKNDDGSVRAEIRLNVTKTNILRASSHDIDSSSIIDTDEENDENYDSSIGDFTIDEDDF